MRGVGKTFRKKKKKYSKTHRDNPTFETVSGNNLILKRWLSISCLSKVIHISAESIAILWRCVRGGGCFCTVWNITGASWQHAVGATHNINDMNFNSSPYSLSWPMRPHTCTSQDVSFLFSRLGPTRWVYAIKKYIPGVWKQQWPLRSFLRKKKIDYRQTVTQRCSFFKSCKRRCRVQPTFPWKCYSQH